MRARSIVLSLLIVGALVGAARADEDAALYQSTAIVTGTDMRQRPSGFASTFLDVLVKLTGDPRLRDDGAAERLAEHAAQFVSSYDYVDPRAGLLHKDDQGTYDRSHELTVRFDPARMQTALDELGLTPWTGKRPLLNPVIVVRSRDPTPFLLTLGTPRGSEMRDAIIRAASEDGVGVVIPTEADLAAWGVIPFGFPTALGEPAPGVLRIEGSLSWDVHEMGWVGRWRARVGRVEHDWSIVGVGFDVAFADMVRGAVLIASGRAAPDDRLMPPPPDMHDRN